MIKFSAFLLLWLISFQSPIFGQNINYEFESGKHYYSPGSAVIPSQMIGSDETGYYFLVLNLAELSQVRLEHFDKNLNRTISQKLEFLPGKAIRKFEYIFYSNNKIYLFSSYADSKLEKRFLEVQTVDKKTLLLNNDLKSVIEVYNTFNKSGKFEFNTSPNGTKLLVYCDYPKKKEKQDYKVTTSDKYKFSVFEGDVDLLWSKEIVFPYNDMLFSVESYMVDDKGRLLFSGVLFNDTIIEITDRMGVFGGLGYRKYINYAEKKGIGFNYIVLSYDGVKEIPFQYKIELEGKYLRDMKIVVNLNDELICTGFYSEKGRKSIKGIFYNKYDNVAGKIKHQYNKEFSKEIITSGLNPYQLKEAERKMQQGEEVEMNQYDFNNLIVNSDGSLVLIAEQYVEQNVAEDVNPTLDYGISRGSISPSGTGAGRRGGSYGGYYGGFYGGRNASRNQFNDILITYISSEGEVNWIKTIPKKQKSMSDYYTSYGVAIAGNDLYLFFNDNIYNFDPKWKNKPYTYIANNENPSVLVVAKISKEGNISIEPTILSRETKVIQKPRGSVQIDEKTVLIFGQITSKFMLSKLTFK